MAAARETLPEWQWEITCSICWSCLSEPVTISCGHSFCRACLSRIWRLATAALPCPECRRVSQVRELPAVDRRLEQLTELAKRLYPQLSQSPEGQSRCARHEQELKLFCELDQTPVCVRCSQSPEHGAHRLWPAEEAADKYREELRRIRSDLGQHLEEAEKLVTEHRRSAAAWAWMVPVEYYKLGYFLMHEEHRCYERVEADEKASRTRLSRYRQTLQDLVLELQEAGRQPTADPLEEGERLLERSESVLSQRAKAVTPELREHPIPGVMEMPNRSRVDITSAGPCVAVSEDLRSAQAGEGWPVETRHPADLAGRCVFAEQAFSSGIQYWEVDVTQLPQWILGIHSPRSGKRRGRKVNSRLSVLLLLCVKKEEGYYFQTYPGSLNHRVKGPVPRVGVCLDYSSAALAFYNVLQRCLIYSFHLTSITQPVTPIFSPGPPLPGTKAGPMTLCPVDSHLCACCYSAL